MKKLIISFLLFTAFNAKAQESFFRGNNNYVKPPVPPFQAPAIVQSGLILNLDVIQAQEILGQI
jgi:hypothetical protein